MSVWNIVLLRPRHAGAAKLVRSPLGCIDSFTRFFSCGFSRRQDGRPDVPAAPRFMADDEGNVSSIRKIVLADFIGL